MNSLVCLSLFCLFSLGLSISLFIYLSIYLSVDIYLSTSTDRDKTFMPNSAVPLGACVCVCALTNMVCTLRGLQESSLTVGGSLYGGVSISAEI